MSATRATCSIPHLLGSNGTSCRLKGIYKSPFQANSVASTLNFDVFFEVIEGKERLGSDEAAL